MKQPKSKSIDVLLRSQVSPQVLVWSRGTRDSEHQSASGSENAIPASAGGGLLALAAFLKKR